MLFSKRGFRREVLGHTGFEIAAVAAVEGLRRIEGQQPRGPGARRHFAELELDRLMLADRLAEGLADLGVGGGEPQRALGNADTAGSDVDAAKFEAARHLR